MEFILKIYSFVITIEIALGSISGISYRDPLGNITLPVQEVNPCNPLYWYPTAIPKYCYVKPTPGIREPAGRPPSTMPLPVPVPMPQAPPLGPPPPMPFLPPPPLPLLPLPVMPIPQPMPFGLPSNPAIPIGGVPYPPQPYPPFLSNHPYRQDQIGMIPGISGLVSNDGGINILPFSDAYSDMLERHKNKLIRKKMQKILRNYENYPLNRKRHRKVIYN